MLLAILANVLAPEVVATKEREDASEEWAFLRAFLHAALDCTDPQKSAWTFPIEAWTSTPLLLHALLAGKKTSASTPFSLSSSPESPSMVFSGTRIPSTLEIWQAALVFTIGIAFGSLSHVGDVFAPCEPSG